MKNLILLAILGVPLWSQTTKIDLQNLTRNANFGGFSHVTPQSIGDSLPSSCNVGEMFFKTVSPPGQNLYGCDAPNEWTLQSGSGGSGPQAIGSCYGFFYSANGSVSINTALVAGSSGVNTAPVSSVAIVGIAQSSVSTGASVGVCTQGISSAVFDATPVIGNAAVVSSTVAGQLHDSGATTAANSVGLVTTACTGASCTGAINIVPATPAATCSAATSSTIGCVKPDPATINITSGTISAKTGTSGATIPLLNGNNTHSGTNSVTGTFAPSGPGHISADQINGGVAPTTADFTTFNGSGQPTQGFYNSALTGNVNRTATAKMKDILSVLDFTGCDPTGISDSQACFQAAVNAAQAQTSGGNPGGKQLYIPAGKYFLATPACYDTLIGSISIFGELYNNTSGAIQGNGSTVIYPTTAAFVPCRPLYGGQSISFRNIGFHGGTIGIDTGENGSTFIEHIICVDNTGYCVVHVNGEDHNWKRIYELHQTVSSQGGISIGDPAHSYWASAYAYSTPATITAVSITGNVATVTAANGFGGRGQSITLSGLSTTCGLTNTAFTATDSTSTNFTIPFVHANCTDNSASGTATPSPVVDGLFDRAIIDDFRDIGQSNTVGDNYCIWSNAGSAGLLSFSNTMVRKAICHNGGNITPYRFYSVQYSHLYLGADTIATIQNPASAIVQVEGFFNYTDIHGVNSGDEQNLNSYYYNGFLVKGAFEGSTIEGNALGGDNSAGTTSTITNFALTSNVGTITATNTFAVNQIVWLSGLTTATFLNGQSVQVASASGSQFTFNFTHANYGSASDTGSAMSIGSFGLRFIATTAGNFGNFIASRGALYSYAVGSTATITNLSLTSNVATITATNTFTNGQYVDLTGLTTATWLNGQTVKLSSQSGSNFTFFFTHADYPSAAETGSAKNVTSNTNPLSQGRLNVAGSLVSASNFLNGIPIYLDPSNQGAMIAMAADSSGTAAGTGVFQVIRATGVGGSYRHDFETTPTQTVIFSPTTYVSAVPTAAITGTGTCTLGTVVGSKSSGRIPVTGTCSTATVTISGLPATTNSWDGGLLRDVTSGINGVQVPFASQTSPTTSVSFTVSAVTSGDELRYGTFIGF